LDDDEQAAMPRVDLVMRVDEPWWYSRLSLPFRRSWRREVATVAGAFLAGLVLGYAAGVLH
jgi:hypothetical protein